MRRRSDSARIARLQRTGAIPARFGFARRRLACASYQALYQALAGFDADLRQHIHLENNLLFPRAIETEEKAAPELRRSTDTFGEHRCFGR